MRISFTVPGPATNFSDLSEGGPRGRRFDNPLLEGRRVDWCRELAAHCGAPAADLYCKKRGFYGAKAWAQAPDLGAQGKTTMCVGTSELCQGGDCDGFSFIECSHHPRCNTTLHLLEETLDRCGEDELTINTLDGPVKVRRLFGDVVSVRVEPRFSWQCGSNPDKDWTTCPDETPDGQDLVPRGD